MFNYIHFECKIFTVAIRVYTRLFKLYKNLGPPKNDVLNPSLVVSETTQPTVHFWGYSRRRRVWNC